jgi:hypothetical protein
VAEGGGLLKGWPSYSLVPDRLEMIDFVGIPAMSGPQTSRLIPPHIYQSGGNCGGNQRRRFGRDTKLD